MFCITLKESTLAEWMTTKLNVRKIYIPVERMDGCEYSLEIIIVPLLEIIVVRLTETNIFWK